MNATAQRPAAVERADLAGLAAIVVAAALVGGSFLQGPLFGFMYLDDGVYLSTAKALAEGRGYRHVELPGEPYQTKYPVLYPAVLSLGWRAWPHFPENLRLVQALNVGLWTLGSWLAYRLMRRAWNAPGWLAAGGAVLAFTAVPTLSVLHAAMSEPLYFALSMGALWTACAAGLRNTAPPTEIKSLPRPPAWREALPATGLAVLTGAAYLTRSIGVALALALAAALVIQRRWIRLAGLVVVGGAAVGGWMLWRHWATEANATIPAAAALIYDLDYSAWLAPRLRTHFWIAWQNLSDLLVSLMLHSVQLDSTAAARALQAGPAQAAWVYALTVLVAAAILLGATCTWRRANPAVHLYVAGYLALVLFWPFEPARFLIVLSPLLFGWLLVGLAVPLSALRERGSGSRAGFSGGQPAAGRARWMPGGLTTDGTARFVLVLGGMLLLLNLYWLLILGPAQRGRIVAAGAQQRALADFLRAQSPPDAIISSHLGGHYHLLTGRKFVPPLPAVGQIRLYYADDRAFLHAGRGASPGMHATDEEFARRHLLPFLRATRATHLVPFVGRPAYERVLAEYRRRHPAWFVRLGEAGGQEVLKLNLTTHGSGAAALRPSEYSIR